jgi:pyrroloquinoline-quinone synthase
VRDAAAFVARLKEEGEKRYHDRHPFHIRMHAGQLSREQIQAWVTNRFYYQTRIPIKDAIILSKSDDPAFRRSWIRRIHDHDGLQEGEGGLASWLRLAKGVGLDVEEVKSLRRVLPAVRFACDAYVQLVRERTLLEAVASSLTEFFSPDIMAKRIVAWEQHYPWVDPETMEYFRGRVTRAKADSREAIDYVTARATTPELEDACVDALVTKTQILWALLDAVQLAHP